MAAFPRATALLVVLTACTLGASASTASTNMSGDPTVAAPTEVTRNPADPAYTVRLRADATGRTWSGWESVSFANADAAPLGRVWFRLWSNGLDGCDPMAITITHPSSGSWGAPTTDCTAIPVDLETPLASGARIRLRFDLRIQVAARNDRFGYAGGLSLLGTALPTLAVHDDFGWHLDPFVAFGESFYSVVGGYRVTLDVPTGLATPTTGRQVATTVEGDRSIRTFVADHVRDFEWAAGGSLRQVRMSDGNELIRVWYRPGFVTSTKAGHVLGLALRSMQTYTAAFGGYPYPEVDVVLTAFRGYGGMEYPQIVFANPEDRVVTHELAHQWWFGLVGDDEYADPWLDESFATWSMFLPSKPWVGCDAYDWPSPTARITNDMTYWSAHRKEYGTIYEGGGCLLADLAHRFGLGRFESVLASYAGDHRFGVARTEDFTSAIERAAATDLPGLDMSAYWDRWRVG
jgi:hypothetical protein